MEHHQTEFTDGTIVLKPFRLEDAQAHLSGEDDEQRHWISGGTSTLESIRNSIRKNQEFWTSNGPVFNFVIWAKGQIKARLEDRDKMSKYEEVEFLDKVDKKYKDILKTEKNILSVDTTTLTPTEALELIQRFLSKTTPATHL